MDGMDGVLVEDGLGGPGQSEMMGDIVDGFLGTEARHVETDGDTLVEGFHDGEVHSPPQITLTGQDDDEGVVGIHLEVGEESEFLQGAGLEEVGLIDDEEDGFADLLFRLESMSAFWICR